MARLPEIVHRIDRLRGVIVQPCAVKESVAFFRADSGALAGPAIFSIQPPEHMKSPSMESRVQEALDRLAPAHPTSALQTMEHLAILKRWFFRGMRVGEIFFADDKGVLPMRRMVHGISRVYRGEKAEMEVHNT